MIPGTTYQFKVKARNIYGYGEFSAIVSILTAQIPDQPIALANVPLVTTAYQIGLSWSAPVFNGGSPLIDYSIWYDNALDQSLT